MSAAIPDPEQVPFLPLWPETGQILGLSRSATYAAAARGEIATCQFGARRVVPCAWIRRKAQLDDSEPS